MKEKEKDEVWGKGITLETGSNGNQGRGESNPRIRVNVKGKERGRVKI